MFFEKKEKTLEERIEEQNKELNKLEKEMKSLKNQTDELFETLGITKEEFDKLMADKENFTDDELSEMEKRKAAWKKEVKKQLENVDHPERKRKARESLKEINRNWFRI